MIGVDWGTSSLRVYDLDPEQPVEIHHSTMGIKRFDDRSRFADHLDEVLDPLDVDDATIILGGMITSANGWIETPYVTTPARADDIAREIVHVDVGGRSAMFVPGLIHRTAHGVDVVRGEECELVGLIAEPGSSGGERRVVVPGTHSKWIQLDGNTINAIATFVTGEMFELVSQHSILGALIQGTEFDGAEFDHGVDAGARCANATGGLLSTLFTVRTRGLFEVGRRPGLHSFLSGLLIGTEIAGADALSPLPSTITIVADGGLGANYQRALRRADRHPIAAPAGCAAAGLRHLAELAAA